MIKTLLAALAAACLAVAYVLATAGLIPASPSDLALALVGTILLLALLTRRGRAAALGLMLFGVAACNSGCATVATGAATGASALAAAELVLQAAGLSVKAYCSLAPEGRADLRARLNLPHLFQCPNDAPPVAGSLSGNWATPSPVQRVATRYEISPAEADRIAAILCGGNGTVDWDEHPGADGVWRPAPACG
jgi:hypothetical protein